MGKIHHFLRNDFKVGEPVINYCTTDQHNRVANILQDIVGVGCRIEKPLNNDGLGWKIVFDGSSDITPPEDLPSLADPPYHFKVEGVSTSQVKVRAGLLETFTGATRVPVTLTVDGGGVSGDLSIFKTITNAGNGVNYVILSKDYPIAVTTLTASCSLTAPTAADKTNRLIAHFTVTAGAIVSGSLVQDWNGGNIREFWNDRDNLSLSFTSDGLMQVYGWSDQAATADPSETVEVLWRGAMGGAAGYSTMPELLQSVPDWSGVDLSGATWDTSPPWKAALAVSHHDLDGLNDQDDDADHAWAWCNTTTGYDDTYARNFAASIGRAADSLAIDLTNSQLCDASADVTLNWDGMLLQNAGSTRVNWSTGAWYTDGTIISGNWLTRELNSAATAGTWTVKHASSYFLIEGDEAADPTDETSGALQVAGGASFRKATQVISSTNRALFLHALGAGVFANSLPGGATVNMVSLVDDNVLGVIADFNCRAATHGGRVRLIESVTTPTPYIAFCEKAGDQGNVKILTPAYGIDVQAGSNGSGLINASVGYYSAGHAGNNETTGDYCLVHQTTGAMLPVFLRGGVLCVD